MTNRDLFIYAAVGLGVWLNGAVTFRLGGRFLFENGPLICVIVGLVIAVLVCAVFRATLTWRKSPPSQAVTVAVVMALPGLFGETARQIVFPWATGLAVEIAPTFDAVIFFGNAALLTYALDVQNRAGSL
jgi:hypothetical protein